MNNILNELNIDTMNAAIAYFVKALTRNESPKEGQVARLFGLSPRKFQTALDRHLKTHNIKSPGTFGKVAEEPKVKNKTKKNKKVGAGMASYDAGYSGSGGGPAAAAVGAVGVGESNVGTMDTSDVNALATMPLDQAKATAEDMIKNNWSSEQNKRNQLRSLSKARTTDQILGLMYNIILRGEGLGVTSTRGRRPSDPNESVADLKGLLDSYRANIHRAPVQEDEEAYEFEYELAHAASVSEIRSVVDKWLSTYGYNHPLDPALYKAAANRVRNIESEYATKMSVLLAQAAERLLDLKGIANLPTMRSSDDVEEAMQHVMAGKKRGQKIHRKVNVSQSTRYSDKPDSEKNKLPHEK